MGQVEMFKQRFSEVTKNDVDLNSEFLGFPVSFPMVAPSNPDLKHFMLHREIARHGGFGIIHLEDLENLDMYKVDGANMPIMVVGTDIAELPMIKRAYDAGIRIFMIEQLQPNMAMIHQMNAIRAENPDAKVILGNFQDEIAVREMLKHGKPDAIKVGLASGSKDPIHGLGFENDLYDSVKYSAGLGVPVIAEGGILEAKDILEMIHAGASMVMMEEVCASAEETAKEPKMSIAGPIVQYKHKFFKTFYNFVPTTGPIKEEIDALKDEMRQIMSITGSKNYQSFKDKAIYK
jgi:IMP dehydrogenase/GMP reductase